MMRTFTLTSVLLLSTFISFSQENSLVGKWTNSSSTDEHEQYEFKTDATAIMIKEGISSPPFKYTFDSAKTPNWVDISVDEDDFKMTMQGLVEFIDNNTMKLELFPESSAPHPINFTTSSSAHEPTFVILKRI